LRFAFADHTWNLVESGASTSEPIMSDTTTQMKAAAADRFGPPSVLKLRMVPRPEPGPSEVVMAIDTAGVGVWDASIREGEWKAPGRPKFPLIPGTDGAGVIAAVGSRVKRFRVGDRVYAYEFGNKQGGFYAEYAACHANHVGKVPKTLSLRVAGAVATTGLTALQGFKLLRARRGATVLIFGATGAVGTIAVQLARYHGCRVLATASGAPATRLVKRLGAHAVIDARSGSLAEDIRKLAPNGVEGVLAFAGGDALERCLDFVKKGGRVVHPNGIEPAPKRRRSFESSSYDGVASAANFAELSRVIARAKIRVPIAGVYPLASADMAHRKLAKGHILGRIVLKVHRL
jgi:NADPH2:quinone reductase